MRPIVLVVLTSLLTSACVVQVPTKIVHPQVEVYGKPSDDGHTLSTDKSWVRVPAIDRLDAAPARVARAQAITFQVSARDPYGDPLQYHWTTTGGTFSPNSGETVRWTPPATPGVEHVTITVTTQRGGVATGSQAIVVEADGSAHLDQ